jgi:hypothetical protein
VISKGVKICLWAYPFFGLTDNYKAKLHESLFDLTHYGNFEYISVYTMPVQFRTFYLKKLIDVKTKENEEMSKQKDSNSSNNARGGRP